MPGLRPAEQLVAGEADDVGAAREAARRRRSPREAARRQIDQRAAARGPRRAARPRCARERGELARASASATKPAGRSCCGGPSAAARCPPSIARRVVAQVGAVGGADLDQARARRRHDRRARGTSRRSRPARRATTIDRAACGEAREARAAPRRALLLTTSAASRRQSARRSLRSTRGAARSALAGRRDRTRGRRSCAASSHGARGRAGRERRAAEVGVQQDPGRVDHRLRMRPRQICRARAAARRSARPGADGRRPDAAAPSRARSRVDHLAGRLAAAPRAAGRRLLALRARGPADRPPEATGGGRLLTSSSRIHDSVASNFRAVLRVYPREARRFRSVRPAVQSPVGLRKQARSASRPPDHV